ncbi:MAG: hypothetical protein ABIK62_08270, partial [candidate division WOR-3 bacterium]
MSPGFQGLGGGRGLFRVQDVRSEGTGWLVLTDHTVLRTVQNPSQALADLLGGVAYAPSDWIEVFGSPGYAAVKAGRFRILDPFGGITSSPTD